MQIIVSRKKGDVDIKDVKNFAKALAKRSVTIGVHKAEGQKTNEISGTKVIDYACYNEFGGNKNITIGGTTSNIADNNPPARPFVRVASDEQLRDKIKKTSKEEFNKVAKNKYKGKARALVQNIYGEIGKLYLEKMTDRLNDPGLYPYLMNAQSTIENKGFDHPLIDTGLLGKSLKVKIRVGNDHVEKVIGTDNFVPVRKRGQ
jgi:hypothetical protein